MISRSEGTRLNPLKPLAGRPDGCPSILRQGGYLKEGDAIQFFSRSADAWLDGEVAEILDDDLLRVDYKIDQYWISKTLRFDSEDIIIPIATEQCLEESDPMFMWSLAKTVLPKGCKWAEKKADAIVPLVTKKKVAKYCGTELFHQTDEATAKIILRTQEMKPGYAPAYNHKLYPYIPGGIFFATSAQETAKNSYASGVILRAYVRLGKILTLKHDCFEEPDEPNGTSDMNSWIVKEMGYDSVCIQRSGIIFNEEEAMAAHAADNNALADEIMMKDLRLRFCHDYVVFDPAQVLYIERA